jgi:hypothetical protein
MMRFRDFVPEQVNGKWYRGNRYESFEAAVAAAGDWVEAERVTPLQIETVVLPNIHAPGESGTTDASLGTVSGWASWYQFLRVWY